MKFRSIVTLMSFIFVCFSMAETGFSEPADVYHVIHVRGTIQIKASGKLLKTNDKISSDDEVVFKMPDAVAAVISPKKGRFTLRTDNLKKETGESELNGFVRTCFFPSHKRISTRGLTEEEVKQMKAEVRGLISLLESWKRGKKESREECLGFVTDMYFGEKNADKAEIWLDQTDF